MARFRNSYFAYFLMYNFYFLSWSLFSTLISVYMLHKGFTAVDVSIVVSTSFISSMIAQPIMGYLNDRIGIRPVTLISFIIVILGGILFMGVKSLLWMTISYSLVLTLINGVNPVMDMLAAASPYKYGQIRIWGTFGYAMGSQLSGLLYQHVSPESIYLVFIFTMMLSVLGVIGVEVPHQTIEKEDSDDSLLRQIFQNKSYLFFLLIYALIEGVTNTGNTYIPSMLEHNGLPVDYASTVVSVAVLVESPLIFFSYIFMDRFSSKRIMLIPVVLITLQFLVYGIGLGLPFQILMTLLAKHAANMVIIMVSLKVVTSLVDSHVVMTGMALLQTAKSLTSIVFQSISGYLIDHYSYEVMNLFLTGTMLISLFLLVIIRLPHGPKEKLFS